MRFYVNRIFTPESKRSMENNVIALLLLAHFVKGNHFVGTSWNITSAHHKVFYNTSELSSTKDRPEKKNFLKLIASVNEKQLNNDAYNFSTGLVNDGYETLLTKHGADIVANDSFNTQRTSVDKIFYVHPPKEVHDTIRYSRKNAYSEITRYLFLDHMNRYKNTNTSYISSNTSKTANSLSVIEFADYKFKDDKSLQKSKQRSLGRRRKNRRKHPRDIPVHGRERSLLHSRSVTLRRPSCSVKTLFMIRQSAEDIHGDKVEIYPVIVIQNIAIDQYFYESFCDVEHCACVGVDENKYVSSCETTYSFTYARIVKNGEIGWSFIKIRSGCSCFVRERHKHKAVRIMDLI